MASMLSFIGWAVLPNYATSFLQSVYYGITIRAGEPRPQPPSPRYARHRRRIFICVITGYLLYTLYETFHQVQANGDFYGALGVSPVANDRTIKSRFRRLAAQHHPDKVTNGQGQGGPGGDNYFVFLKLAQDTLLDPAKRFAYDRFGPDILNWGSQERSMQDFLYTAVQKSLVPQYAGGFLTILFLNFTWWSDWGRYVSFVLSWSHLGWLLILQWRFFTFAGLLVLELTLITQPLSLFIPASYIPAAVRDLLHISLDHSRFYLLPFQILTLARQMSITLHIFISQLTPPDLTKKTAPATAGDRLSTQTMQRLGQLLQLSRATDVEATRLLQMGYAPFRGDKEGTAALRKGMKEGLVLSSVRASPEVQAAVRGAVGQAQEKDIDP